MTHTLVHQSCSNHRVTPDCLRLVGLAVSTALVGSKEDGLVRLALVHGNQLEVAQNSSKPDNPSHHQPCKQSQCRPCVPRNNLGNHDKCLGRSMGHTLGCRT